MLYHVFSDNQVLTDVRREILALVHEEHDEMGNAVNLQTRQVRKIMNELHQDNLVCEYEFAIRYCVVLT